MSRHTSYNEDLQAVASGLHRASLRLLRRLRLVDKDLEISTARLSTLSVLVFVGPRTVSEMAVIEQVSQPTMSSLIQGLMSQKLVSAKADPNDRRTRQLHPTAKGKKLLLRGQKKRIDTLMTMMSTLSERDIATLSRAADLIDGLLDGAGE